MIVSLSHHIWWDERKTRSPLKACFSRALEICHLTHHHPLSSVLSLLNRITVAGISAVSLRTCVAHQAPHIQFRLSCHYWTVLPWLAFQWYI